MSAIPSSLYQGNTRLQQFCRQTWQNISVTATLPIGQSCLIIGRQPLVTMGRFGEGGRFFPFALQTVLDFRDRRRPRPPIGPVLQLKVRFLRPNDELPLSGDVFIIARRMPLRFSREIAADGLCASRRKAISIPRTSRRRSLRSSRLQSTPRKPCPERSCAFRRAFALAARRDEVYTRHQCGACAGATFASCSCNAQRSSQLKRNLVPANG
jgi:hypothetical protein